MHLMSSWESHDRTSRYMGDRESKRGRERKRETKQRLSEWWTMKGRCLIEGLGSMWKKYIGTYDGREKKKRDSEKGARVKMRENIIQSEDSKFLVESLLEMHFRKEMWLCHSSCRLFHTITYAIIWMLQFCFTKERFDSETTAKEEMVSCG